MAVKADRVSRAVDILVRLAGGLALALGLALWSGRLYGLVTLHMALGAAVVAGCWIMAAIALRSRAAPGLALATFAWGTVALWLGVAQTGLMPDASHWIVRVAHLLLGVGAIGPTALLAKALRASANA